MKLCLDSLSSPFWAENGISVPAYDVRAAHEKTATHPRWIHFGAGNLYRAYVSRIADTLLEKGLTDTGILAVTYNREAIDQVYAPADGLCLYTELRADGAESDKPALCVVGSTGLAVSTDSEGMAVLRRAFRDPSLCFVSFTITEKGYSTTSPDFLRDLTASPADARGAMGILTALLIERFDAACPPLTIASMDNCSGNGDKLAAAVLATARAWEEKGLAPRGFAESVSRNSFPISMIDKITPAPSASVLEKLEKMGLTDIAPVRTGRGTMLAPFVNAEECEYLVLEDAFAGDRLPLDKAGVYLTDRENVRRAERMKVTTCLNPLHTTLAVFGCLLGYTRIAAEMDDPLLAKLVDRLGHAEGLPVAPDCPILPASRFLEDVITRRLPNKNLPDAPQRIATDTSQKVGVRYGETIKEYLRRGLDTSRLTVIPLTIAAWLRMMDEVDDAGQHFTASPDPLFAEVKQSLSVPETQKADAIRAILSRTDIFGVSYVEAGLADKVIRYYTSMERGTGAIRATAEAALAEDA